MQQPDEIYLDYNATTPVHPEVAEAVRPLLYGDYGNPSAPYAAGQAARGRIQAARAQIADLIGASPEEIVFTSGGTEAINLAIQGARAARSQPARRHVVTSAIGHPAELETCRRMVQTGCELTILPVDGAGRVDPQDLAASLRPDTFLVSIMHANNETGSLQPVGAIGRICRSRGILFHVDGVQAAGKIPVDVKDLDCDFYSLSGHKFGGLKGAGALYVRKGAAIEPLQHGGRQEEGRRAGTENVPGIVALGKAAEIARRDLERNAEHSLAVAAPFIALTRKLPAVRLNGHPTDRLPNTVNLCCLYADAMSVVLSLSLLRIYVGTGSACAARSPGFATGGRQTPSHVLRAMGLSDLAAFCSIRVSVGPATTLAQAEYAASQIAESVSRIRQATAPADIGACDENCPCFLGKDGSPDRAGEPRDE